MNAPTPLELWGGVEPTVNRVGDRFFDQMERSGHAGPRGLADLDRFAALGLRALRYPVLWERLAPDEPTVRDWSWADGRLGRLRALGVRPIVGLIHHGSGPRRTHLLDPGFPAGLADYARQVAERFPWVEEWTPVNEPLTTARFSALYGHWYPHARDDRSFVRALLHQCRAVVLAMRAIRAVNPAARLVQTEDLGRTWSTAPLARRAEFENARRWLSWDLLEGRVDPGHALWAYLGGPGGANPGELRWFVDNPCPPDVLGVNTYVTSERFLDHRPHRYPAYAWSGGPGRTAYADVVAVRASLQGAAGPGRLLREAWRRYGRPVAITEAHLACTREEQMRWVAEIWRDARVLREREGADVRAVTLWSLLGTFDWCHLLTREAGDYEPGIFDLRPPTPDGQPRPTALARLARELAATGESDHPVLAIPGWWRRQTRFDHPPARACQRLAPSVRRRPAVSRAPTAVGGGAGGPVPPPWLLVIAAGDAGGTALAQAFGRACEIRGLPCRLREGTARETARDLETLAGRRPWAVIHVGTGTGTNGRVGFSLRPGSRERLFTHGLPVPHPGFVGACLDELLDEEVGEEENLPRGALPPPALPPSAARRYAPTLRVG